MEGSGSVPSVNGICSFGSINQGMIVDQWAHKEAPLHQIFVRLEGAPGG